MKGPNSACRSSLLLLLAATAVSAAVASGAEGSGRTRFTPMHSLFSQEDLIQPPPLEAVQEGEEGSSPRGAFPSSQTTTEASSSSSSSSARRTTKRGDGAGRSEEEEQRRQARVREVLHKVRPEAGAKLERVPEDEFRLLQRDHPELRRQLWGGSSSSSEKLINYADPGDDYDMWQQAYRMLGGFIDCDHSKSQGSGDRNNNNNAATKEGACSRWMMWASVSVAQNLCPSVGAGCVAVP
jgi:hypothetical protein